MELRHLRYFIKAAELLHFTRAAESLYISQPTLSIHIQQLEEELGSELFARVGRNVRLTEAGKLLLTRAHQAVQELETASEEIDSLRGLLRGNLSVYALPGHGTTLLPAWISAFNAVHPDVHIKARSGASDDIEKRVVDGTVDLGISILPVEHNELTVAELFTSDLFLLVAKEHALAKKKEVDIRDLHELPVALPSPSVVWTRQLAKSFADKSVQPRIVVEYDDGNALLQIAKLGHLAALLPRAAINRDPGVHLLPVVGLDLRVTTAALWMHLSPAATAFLEIVKDGVKSLKWDHGM